jgi:hypothetical protein
MASHRAVERPASDPSLRALAAAEREFDRWLRSDERSAVALRLLGSAAQLREALLARVRATVSHERPGAACCQWISENISAWAPLELLFPVHDHAGSPGISGEMPLHSARVVELAYGHMLADALDFDKACERLQADAQRLELEICAGRAICALLDESAVGDSFWVEELRGMQLAMAEYLHRHAIGLTQVMSDAMVTSYTARIGNMQRNLRERYAPAPLHVRRALDSASA